MHRNLNATFDRFLSLGSYAAAGQLQQRPSPKGGGILKASWWVPWEKEEMPDIEYVLQSYDTAFEVKQAGEGFLLEQNWLAVYHMALEFLFKVTIKSHFSWHL